MDTDTLTIADYDPLPAPLASGKLLLILLKTIQFHAPSDWVAWAFIVGIAFLCLLLSGFVSGSEIAYFGLTPAQIDELEEDEDNASSRKAFNLISNSERLLATILISNNLVNITMVVLLTFAINQTMQFLSPVVDFLLQTVFLTFLLLLFGEIFPKLLARSLGPRWVKFAASGLTVLYHLCAWPAKLMVNSTGILNRMVVKKQESISTDELERALEISDVKEGQEKEMLEGILSFGETEVSEIMISRVDVTAIEYHAGWEEAVKTILDSGYSRIPVYDTSQDSIRGILYSKDLLPYIGNADESFRWQDLIREAYFVPESRRIDDLLEDFRKKKIHIAIVIDEYGGTMGIVTLEDIIEEIVGEIDDEYDDGERMYKRLGDGSYIFDGKIPLGDFCHITGVDEEDFSHHDEAETLAGLLLAIKGDFPQKKESIVEGRCRFMVLDMERHRITQVRVSVMPEDDPKTR